MPTLQQTLPSSAMTQYRFMPSDALLQEIQRYSFPGDSLQDAIRRMFDRLLWGIEQGILEQMPESFNPDLLEKKEGDQISVRLHDRASELVDELVKNNMEGDAHTAIAKFLSWSMVIPPPVPISGPQEALMLLGFIGKPGWPAQQAIDFLTQRCSRQQADSFLIELEQLGSVRLIQNLKGTIRSKNRLWIGGKLVASIRLQNT